MTPQVSRRARARPFRIRQVNRGSGGIVREFLTRPTGWRGAAARGLLDLGEVIRVGPQATWTAAPGVITRSDGWVAGIGVRTQSPGATMATAVSDAFLRADGHHGFTIGSKDDRNDGGTSRRWPAAAPAAPWMAVPWFPGRRASVTRHRWQRWGSARRIARPSRRRHGPRPAGATSARPLRHDILRQRREASPTAWRSEVWKWTQP